jgi:hypothetical protein
MENTPKRVHPVMQAAWMHEQKAGAAAQQSSFMHNLVGHAQGFCD